MARPVIGVIGGSGVYDLPGLAAVRRERVATPFGEPSDAFVVGTLGAQELVFIPRHGSGHRLGPGEVNYRANLWGLKKLGATRVISLSAVGSLREEIAPGHLVLPDQFIDRTVARRRTFFDDGVVAHVGVANPVCPQLHAHVAAAAVGAGATVHSRGTYVCIEGPQFSTRAESEVYRAQGADVIGMTNLPEAKLAREAELCYATLALATDYDTWHPGHDAVNVEAVIAVLRQNVALAREVVRAAAASGEELAERTCACGHALDHAVITDPALIPAAARARLALLLGDRFPAPAPAAPC
ncbi:MAG: S-methyl-5'-thioadenosine phosphorylase [Myxococcales bacterium]